MNKTLMALALLSVISTAHAGNDNANPCGNNGNNCNTGGAGGNGTGIGIGVGVGGQGGAGGQGGDADATAIGLGGTANAGAISGSSSNAGAISGSAANNSNNSSNSTTTNVAGDKVEAPNIPTASSIAVSGNGTAGCLIHKQLSFNAFFVSFANGGHEVEFICKAEELGLHEVAVQMSCNKDSGFKKAYNQVAELNGTPACLE
jgi:hypothetical protein